MGSARLEAKKRERLIKYKHRLMCFEVLKHRCLYYCWNAPEITDAEYDLLEKRLVAYERRTGARHDRSPTRTVGSSKWTDYPVLVRAAARRSLIDRNLATC